MQVNLYDLLQRFYKTCEIDCKGNDFFWKLEQKSREFSLSAFFFNLFVISFPIFFTLQESLSGAA